MSAQILSIDKSQYAMLDMHGEHVCFLHIDDARELLKQGLAKTFGSKKRIHGIKMLVELREGGLTDAGEIAPGKAMSAANYAGCRFIFKQSVDNGRGYVIIYRLKNLEITESPEHGLLRILTPPALESNVHTLRFEATETERAADPGQERRKRNRDIFHMSHQLMCSRPRRAAAAVTPIRPQSLRFPVPAIRIVVPVAPTQPSYPQAA